MNFAENVKKMEEEKKNLYAPLQENPMDLDEIFRVMIEGLRYNYAGYEKKKRYFTPSEYRTYVLSAYRYGTLTIQMLVRSLHQFAADMRDRHLTFQCTDWIDYQNTDPRFRVRAQKDALWVTEADPESGLVPGDKILRIQRMTPEQIRSYMRNHSFYSSEPERELWGGYLSMAEHAEIRHEDGTTETFDIRQFPRTAPVCHTEFRMLNESVSCLKLEKLEEESLNVLLERHGREIGNSSRLILDLRRCIGGEESAVLKLIPWLIDKPVSLKTLLGETGSYVNCTRTNCELRYRILSTYAETLSDPEQIEAVEQERDFYLKNYGRGVCYKEGIPVEDLMIMPQEERPEKVIILTDTFCENEGEQLVEMCRRCGADAAVIGRPTMGTLDYFDNITVELNEHMTLSYPIAMSEAAYRGEGIAEKGLPVDEYIPWTKEEIKEDLILRRALEY